MSEIHQKRREKFRHILHDKDIPAAIITNLVNVRYLSGFTGSNAALVIGQDPQYDRISTDGRYTTQIAAQCGDLPAVISKQTAVDLVTELVKNAISRIGFEAKHLSVAHYRTLCSIGNSDFVDLQEGVEQLRAIKDDSEIELLVTAGKISDQALYDLIDGTICGLSEREVSRKLENYLFDHGATALSFETIVASGSNSAIPHHSPSDKLIAPGDFLKIDFGAEYQGYHADITRTFVVGSAQSWQREIYDIVSAAQESAANAVRPGVELSSIDTIARSTIDDAGYGERFIHGLGHGVGLEIHEAPSLGPASKGSLRVGEFVTVEPGIYLPDKGGVRIEDTLEVQANGARPMTHFPKTLMELAI